METFSLQAHPQSQEPPIQLNCTVGRREKALSVAFQLYDPNSLVLLPEKQKRERLYGLWDKTCFEFFFAEPGALNYWEVNLSPSSSWNLFSFTANRVGMEKEEKLKQLPVLINHEKKTGLFSLGTKLHLDKLNLAESVLQVGVSAVIQTKNREHSYWALFHPNSQPDFHDRASFVLQL